MGVGELIDDGFIYIAGADDKGTGLDAKKRIDASQHNILAPNLS